MDVFWFIPTQGDGRFLGTTDGGRPATFDYFAQVARAADSLGYHGALLPTGRGCDDAWITAAGLAAITTRLKYLVAVRPGLVSPTLAYRMAATFDRQTAGRILINVVAGGDTDELHGDGVFLSSEERYEQTDEFLTIWRGLARGETVDHAGKHLTVWAAKQFFPAHQQPHIPLYFGGSSLPAVCVAARHVDVYLTWGEPPAAVAEKVADVRRAATAKGRSVRFGIRLHVVVRDTVAEARTAAEKLIEKVTPEVAAAAQGVLAKYESEGQRRMLALQRNGRDGLWLRPDLWAGVGLVRGGAGTAMVGDGPTVAALMREYAAVGIDTFILSGYPHLEEAYHVAEHVFPHLPLSRATTAATRGEVIANGAVRIPGGANGTS
ncbi:FMNH2-dependent alkanesulfonate monooxygenase [Limnoglobus roseus]|uniref:alkanesulfonate monooxygenase n=1 Tax=Limnoglobus roseus TaxID=2598579 RepID=A0A5C1AH99_9BACT|nr:FMNH2-dependent alkanesulfonate monooxygenase [Limnoglobus roseus]QEL16338.1 alkanesulfonate monooxygenase, FMNH(2)-dependent [Limnoglobus roseus]